MIAEEKTANTLATPDSGVSDVSVMLPADFLLDSGEELSHPELRIRVNGDRTNPIIVVAGGISAGKIVSDHDGTSGWWRNIVNIGGAIDPTKHCIVSFDFLPNAEEEARTISIDDQARALAHALSILEIDKIDAFVGASYGGMTALTFAAQFPERVHALCVISAADRPHPWATAQRGIQRRIVAFGEKLGAPEEAISLARQLAMTTYRTPEEFAERFAYAPGDSAGKASEVCNYLISRGDAFTMEPARYVTLSDSIDRHSVDPSSIDVPTKLIAVKSDRLVPVTDMRGLAAKLSKASLTEIESVYGHDAFLKEVDAVSVLIREFLKENSYE